MSPTYITQTQPTHGRTEEMQWARLFESGDPVKGMLVVFLQKMCAAFHEFEPAYLAGGLNAAALPHFNRRLAARVGVVLTMMDQNGLHQLSGYSDLVLLQQAAASADSLAALAALAEPIHQVNHTITDAIEAWSSPQ